MNSPKSTYRLQLHKDFNFDDVEGIVAYLSDLGVDTVYASPIYKATPGSAHGYDGTDTTRINSEIGSKKQLTELSKRLKARGIKWLQDIVPNHMAYHQNNSWLMDVLELGHSSRYSHHFDTALSSIFMDGKLMVPILGKPLETAIESKELNILSFRNRFYLDYYGQRVPLNPASYPHILGRAKKTLSNDAIKLSKQIGKASATLSSPEWDQQRKELFGLLRSPENRKSVADLITQLNDDTDFIAAITDAQHYRLCHWQETDRKITFRRFFTVNGLICLNTHLPEVFADTHALTKRLYSEGIIDGLRLDHIDGLYDPSKYLRDLRSFCGPETYIVAEKILEHGEKLPEDWPIQGTTGYEFLALVNNLLTDRRSEKKLDRFYTDWIGLSESVEEQQIQKKADILSNHMQGELDNLARLFAQLDLGLEDHTLDNVSLRQAIAAFLVYFPVYRLYEAGFPFSQNSLSVISGVFKAIKADQYADKKGIKALEKMFKLAQKKPDADYSKRAATFFLRCMQFTGPVMAKGVEDTLMYTYHRFIGHNEVGDHPSYFGINRKHYHREMLRRQEKWPLALNGSATHDTKRGEDVRARLQILTAIPDLWTAKVTHWWTLIQESYTGKVPHRNDVYFLFQTLFGAYPLPGEPTEGFEERLQAYLEKYLREGKERSDWAAPNTEYEQEFKNFASFLLIPENTFFQDFNVFLLEWADYGITNSLAQVTLKMTSPGAPDVYQGTELWDFSFVDPDNRRPVDYELRRRYLQDIENQSHTQLPSSLWSQRYNGKIKLWLTQTLLQLRKRSATLSANSEYLPLKIKGKHKKQVIAFARRHRQEWLIVAVPLHLAYISGKTGDGVLDIDWADTRIVLPSSQPLTWQHILDKTQGEGTEIALAAVFEHLPIAILHAEEPEKKRTAGILLHITSLPSPFGIGDLGPEAYRFAKQLQAAGQHWWQVLPLGPLSTEQFYSPYSTLSTMAGNPLLISLDLLVQDGFLDTEEVILHNLPSSDQVDFAQVEAVKNSLLEKAFDRINAEDLPDFYAFCKEESAWLDDYALFVVLRKEHGNSPWYTWPSEFRHRDKKVLAAFSKDRAKEIEREKWIQYTFVKQWQQLRAYCNDRNVHLLGDVPIYVSYDSADVWAHPELFSLDDDGKLKGIAGVPPDYFNSEGQLWGMPVFNWAALKKQKYAWWIQRLMQTRKLFDHVRLDHFRAFASYWEVPAEKKTAIHGKWKKGPGQDFFEHVKREFGELPFVAEDLGEIDQDVYDLRDHYQIPGMKVLQFAFGDDLPVSPHIPHQHGQKFFVYTGTHDNNTSLGWFSHDIDKQTKSRIGQYLGKKISKKNCTDELIRMAYASVAKATIVPMQDILNLGEENRMNTPASTTGNWTWRMQIHAFNEKAIQRLKRYTELYDR